MDDETVPLNRAALDRDLQGSRRPQAIIQLAGSLRDIGEPTAAVELLENHPTDSVTGDAAQAFLALALRNCGRNDEALRAALMALATTLPQYGTAIAGYTEELLPESAQA